MVQTKWGRLVRFIASEDNKEYVGEPELTELDVGAALADGEAVRVRVFKASSALDVDAEPTRNVLTIKTVLPPLAQTEIGLIRCIGLNYRSHAAELNLELPTVPALFYKPSTSLGAPNAPVVVPHQVTDEQADYEGEVAFVIGKTARNVSVQDALDHVLGYMCANDVTGRKHQFAGAQWSFGKGFDGFAPMGPCLVSTGRIPDPTTIAFRTTLNGQKMQEGRVDDMIFSVAETIAFLSQGTTLEPGNVVLSGTPHGIGVSRKPPVFLKPGDEVRISMNNGLGTLVNSIAYEDAPAATAT